MADEESRPSERSGAVPFAAGVLLVGAIAAAFAVSFRWTLLAVTRLVSGENDVVSAMRSAPLPARLLVPGLGGLLAGVLVLVASKLPSGAGVSGVMEAVVLGRVRLSMRSTLLKSAASWCAIASGGSLGREGPLIQFGGAAGKVVGARLRLSPEDTRMLIAAGTAAGFAAAYNTPFAAVLFVVEVVTGIIVLRAIVPALVATVVASAITRAFVGAGPIYGQRAFNLVSPAELVLFAGLGVVVALAAQGFMRLLSAGENAFRKRWLPMPWRPLVGGLLGGAIVMVLPEVAGNGYEPLAKLLDGSFALGFVVLLVVGKSIATTFSVSSGSPGGVFTPSLLLGGGVGLLFAALLERAGLHLGPLGGYALVGMAAATAATTHAPLMAAVMAFELSGDYAIVLPLVLATAVATVVSRALRRDSIYTAELRDRGLGWEMTMEGRKILE